MTTSSFDEGSAEVKEHERRAVVILDGMYQFVALLSPSGEIRVWGAVEPGSQ